MSINYIKQSIYMPLFICLCINYLMTGCTYLARSLRKSHLNEPRLGENELFVIENGWYLSFAAFR